MTVAGTPDMILRDAIVAHVVRSPRWRRARGLADVELVELGPVPSDVAVEVDAHIGPIASADLEMVLTWTVERGELALGGFATLALSRAGASPREQRTAVDDLVLSGLAEIVLVHGSLRLRPTPTARELVKRAAS